MTCSDVSADHVIAELLDMGFEFVQAVKALEAVGPCLTDALEFILNDCCKSNAAKSERSQQDFSCSTSQNCSLGKVSNSHALHRMKQSNITDHLPLYGMKKRNLSASSSIPSFSGIVGATSWPLDKQKSSNVDGNHQLKAEHKSSQFDTCSHILSNEFSPPLGQRSFQDDHTPQSIITHEENVELHWEKNVNNFLRKQFGFSSLKAFQKEAIRAWLDHKDCLILAATGSGKSLCFQIPALLSGKVVVVISPLISLMHDQCLKLSKHGISACFLGSGQPDSAVERKAMNGMYKVVYVCPETLLRLIDPLKSLAENHRIALFAIDEAHCVSKWGHDFRPDYRRLSVLREKFSSSSLESLRFDVPVIALTATATIPVRDDIIKSLYMSKETRIILTSFYRPNLRFSVKHSSTSVSSYEKDFCELVNDYASSRVKIMKGTNRNLDNDECNCKKLMSSLDSSDEEGTSQSSDYCTEDDDSSAILGNEGYSLRSEGDQLTVEYLEDELERPCSFDDFDVSFAEFPESSPAENFETGERPDPHEHLGGGPTIIYVPTRKETTKLADYFCRSGVRAAAYHAKLPKAHLRCVHKEFHQNLLEVVVATIAFGMGIDKSNVRRIIHYGWPQSLEAYYQEAGRAGRDGMLSDCILYANLRRIPTLLPSKRSEQQTRQAYKMLSDCYRYGINAASCRAKTLVHYFGEDFSYNGCHLCDVCTSGPPQIQNFMDEAKVFLSVLKFQSAHVGKTSFGFVSDSGAINGEFIQEMIVDKPNFSMVIKRIREQNLKFTASDQSWWRGLARLLEDKGYIKEADEKVHVSIIKPEITELGIGFLKSTAEDSFYAHPYADMLLSSQDHKPYSSFSEWGRGWADPEIRRQRLQGRRKCRTKKSKRKRVDLSTVRGRLAAKFSKIKR